MMNTTTKKIMFMTIMFGVSMVAYSQESNWGPPHHISAKFQKNNDEADINGEVQLKNLRGKNNIGIKIDGEVQLKHLLQHRRLGPLPKSNAIQVPCQNSTSNCGMHGSCRISGENKFCHCDSGYYSLDKYKPCNEKGESQTLVALLWYFVGYLGIPAFILGWTALGVATLSTCCCGLCCYSQSGNDSLSDTKRASMTCIGILLLIAFLGLWIYGAVMVSTNNCVSSNGVPCDMW